MLLPVPLMTHSTKSAHQHLNPPGTENTEQLHKLQTVSRFHTAILEALIRPASIQNMIKNKIKKTINVRFFLLFFHSFCLGCINVSVLFWSYITQTGRASSYTACWWQTTPSLWEQAFNSMCNQFDGQPLSRAVMNTASVFHTCFYSVCVSVGARLLL